MSRVALNPPLCFRLKKLQASSVGGKPQTFLEVFHALDAVSQYLGVE